MVTIYEPTGRAREYSPLALNLYKGCAHRCVYCYARKMTMRWGMTADEFNSPKSRPGLLEALEKCAHKIQGDHREINLCFMCDPYSTPEEADITREVLLILEKNKLTVSILTKAGTKACRDFDIFARNPSWKFGTTLTCFGDIREQNEPNAASTGNRITTIEEAKKSGIFTYVSLEPVFDAKQALEILRWGDIVDFWKIGKINYNSVIEKRIDWKRFVADARKILDNRPHMFKKDLLEAAGEL